jgi:hypothetical protein
MKGIKHLPMYFGGLSVIALAMGSPSAIAQEKTTWIYTCQDIGASQPEPLGDKEGHSFSIGESSCRAGPGPQAGGVMTAVTSWEWNGPNAVMLFSNCVVRKPGAIVVCKNDEAKLTLTMTDGKVTGWTASGGGVDTLATGDWASMNGKRFHWTAKSVGPGSQFIIESTNE